ncbi:protein phosphatase 4 core regulatory subunit R2 [Lipomyces arxii]|uniref:protein phosphatase 4 core regulatory subunit R2 n=1 Tax=Lipomyces arxii TaxID=56418 RepID=UPI0034CEF3CE
MLLNEVASTGAISGLDWPEFRLFLITKLKEISRTAFSADETEEDQAWVNDLGRAVDSFTSDPPFTIQRLAELVKEPNRYYKDRTKFLRAVERIIGVESGVGEFARAFDNHSTAEGGVVLSPIPWAIDEIEVNDRTEENTNTKTDANGDTEMAD